MVSGCSGSRTKCSSSFQKTGKDAIGRKPSTIPKRPPGSKWRVNSQVLLGNAGVRMPTRDLTRSKPLAPPPKSQAAHKTPTYILSRLCNRFSGRRAPCRTSSTAHKPPTPRETLLAGPAAPFPSRSVTGCVTSAFVSDAPWTASSFACTAGSGPDRRSTNISCRLAVQRIPEQSYAESAGLWLLGNAFLLGGAAWAAVPL